MTFNIAKSEVVKNLKIFKNKLKIKELSISNSNLSENIEVNLDKINEINSHATTYQIDRFDNPEYLRFHNEINYKKIALNKLKEDCLEIDNDIIRLENRQNVISERIKFLKNKINDNNYFIGCINNEIEAVEKLLEDKNESIDQLYKNISFKSNKINVLQNEKLRKQNEKNQNVEKVMFDPTISNETKNVLISSFENVFTRIKIHGLAPYRLRQCARPTLRQHRKHSHPHEVARRSGGNPSRDAHCRRLPERWPRSTRTHMEFPRRQEPVLQHTHPA